MQWDWVSQWVNTEPCCRPTGYSGVACVSHLQCVCVNHFIPKVLALLILLAIHRKLLVLISLMEGREGFQRARIYNWHRNQYFKAQMPKHIRLWIVVFKIFWWKVIRQYQDSWREITKKKIIWPLHSDLVACVLCLYSKKVLIRWRT